MGLIGSLVIGMSVNTEKVSKGLSKVTSDAKGFGDKLGGIGSQLGGLAKTASGFDSVKASIGAALGALTAAAAVGSVVSLTKSSLDSVAAQSKLADRIGTTTEKLAGFRLAASSSGAEADQAAGLLGKFEAKLAQASAAVTPAGDALKKLGLDAKDLVKLDTIDAFKLLSDSLSKVENPAERAAAAAALFEEEGIGLLGLLTSGSAKIDGFTAEAQKLGLAFNRIDGAKVEAANRALGKIGSVVEGIGNSLAIQLAPLIEAAAKQIQGLAEDGGGLGPKISGAIETASGVIGTLADALQYVRSGFKFVQAVASEAGGSIADNISIAGKAVEAFINLIPGMHVQFSDVAKTIGEDLHKLADEQLKGAMAILDEPPPSSKIKAFFDSIKSSADASAKAIVGNGSAMRGLSSDTGAAAAKVAELEKTLRTQIATFGQTSNQVEIYKLAEAGASAESLKTARALADQVEAMEKAKKASDKLADDAKKTIEDTRTPSEAFAKAKEELAKQLAAGLIDPETYKRAVEKAKADSGIDDFEKRAGAVELGSAEARSSILANRNRATSTNDPIKDVAKSNREQLAEVKRLPPLLEKIADVLKAPTEVFQF